MIHSNHNIYQNLSTLLKKNWTTSVLLDKNDFKLYILAIRSASPTGHITHQVKTPINPGFITHGWQTVIQHMDDIEHYQQTEHPSWIFDK